jgi:biopolymer transport protein ExbB
MTAIGLLVAVPAVFAYNFLQSRNKKIAAQLSGFSTELLANIASNGAVKPALPAAAAKAAAKPAPKA